MLRQAGSHACMTVPASCISLCFQGSAVCRCLLQLSPPISTNKPKGNCLIFIYLFIYFLLGSTFFSSYFQVTFASCQGQAAMEDFYFLIDYQKNLLCLVDAFIVCPQRELLPSFFCEQQILSEVCEPAGSLHETQPPSRVTSFVMNSCFGRWDLPATCVQQRRLAEERHQLTALTRLDLIFLIIQALVLAVSWQLS